jgi:hypothetical protein
LTLPRGKASCSSLFASHGWDAEVTEYGAEEANFGRWPWPPIDRHDPNWPHNYLITAYRLPTEEPVSVPLSSEERD